MDTTENPVRQDCNSFPGQEYSAPALAAQAAADRRLSASEAAMECFSAYASERPEVVALWALGIGFILGWKLKPW